ncbi:protein kinase and pp2c-like domain-containing protein [Hordeum vulgare]|nr:protein kinase and pp2c-like domain-containing protein [Hordeum vulgare]
MAIRRPRVFSLRFLKAITNSFSKERIIGHGATGVVYKGVLHNGEVIAVKKLYNRYDSSGEKLGNGEAQFHNELMNLIGVQHQNIIQLVGYCYETHNVVTECNGKLVLAAKEERILCLEYMPCGSLKDNLSVDTCHQNTSMKKISSKFDIFSLGVIIIHVIAGQEGNQNYRYMTSVKFIENVQENWEKRLDAAVPSHTLEQVRTCAEIALRCVELEREKRPNITEIVNELNKIDVDESSDTGQKTGEEEHTTLDRRVEIDASLIIPPLEDSSRCIIKGGRLHDFVSDTINSSSSEDNFPTVDGSEQVDLKSLLARLLDDLLTGRSLNTDDGHIRMISVFEAQRALQLMYLRQYNAPIHEPFSHLETLDLRGTSVRELSSFVSRLRNLKCLRADETTGVPGIGNLTSLEELRLDYVGTSVNFVIELGKLKKLRELDIWIQELDKISNEALLESLRNLDNIEVVDQQDVDMLGHLLKLVSLGLQMPSDVFLSIKGDSLFPKLRSFDTSSPFRFLPGAMPSLESLHFKVDVRALKHAGFALNDFAALGNLLPLQSMEVEINFRGAREVHVAGTEQAMKRAVDNHPNNPTASIRRT